MNYTIENFHQESFLENLNNNSVIFLPENLGEVENSSEYIYSEATTDIRKIFRLNNQQIEYLTSDKPLLRTRKSADWFGPIIFIGFSALTQNPELLNVSLNLISNYLYDFFKGNTSSKTAKFEIVIEKQQKKEYKKIKYEGSVDGIKEIGKIIKDMTND